MNSFICPVCSDKLVFSEKSCSCSNGHSFDLSKSGYVNLLMSQQSKLKRHGDDKTMVRARRDFLDKGYYTPLLDSICKTIEKHFSKGSSLLDAGCGEGWYTANLYGYLESKGLEPDFLAVDISKSAMDYAAKRNSNIKRAVASVYSLPVADNSCDVVLNVFAPLAVNEFLRILKPGGLFIAAEALENHLFSLKQSVYDNAYKNEIGDFSLDGFELIDKQEIKSSIHLNSNEDIITLFKMTPYYYKTSEKDFNKLLNISEFTTETEFALLTYRKK